MLKPSEKMLAQLAENDEPIDYSIDSIPLDFASQSQYYSDPDLEQLFTEDRARTLYIYKINNLVKTKQKPTLNYSQNSVKIGFIDKDDYIKITGYEISDFNFKLQIQQNTTVQDNSTSYVMIDEKDILINDISKQDKEFLESYDLKIVSINEPITENNKNECYIIEEYKRPYSPDGINIIKSMHLVKITDFKWKNQNSIYLVLQKSLSEDTVFTGIEIKYPKSMLFGNIKCWGNINVVYSYPSSIVENASLVPLLSMPIETEPNLRVFQYWFTESFLPWSIAKNYIKGKDILDLINKNGLEQVLLNYLTYRYNYDIKFQGATYDEKGNPTNPVAKLRQKFEGQKPEDVIDGLFEKWKRSNPSFIDKDYIKIFKQIIYMLSNYTYSKYAINKGYNDDIKLIAPYYFELISTPYKTENNFWIFQNCIVKLNSLYFNILSENSLKDCWENVKLTPFSTFDDKWYFVIWRGNINNKWNINNFYNSCGGNYYVVDEKSQIQLLFKNNEYFFGIKEFYNDKSKNKITISKNNVLNVIKEFDIFDINNNYIKNVYRWKITGKPILPEIDFISGEIKWKDSKPYELNVINNDISVNSVYLLEANYFNWLSIPNELETNSIPSLIPAEIKLSDGEYGKYLTNLIVFNDKIKEVLEYIYSSDWKIFLFSKANWAQYSSTKKFFKDNIKINYDKKLFNLNKIEISGIWGYGNYDITIFTEKEQININNLELFNKNNEKLSLITLEI